MPTVFLLILEFSSLWFFFACVSRFRHCFWYLPQENVQFFLGRCVDFVSSVLISKAFDVATVCFLEYVWHLFQLQHVFFVTCCPFPPVSPVSIADPLGSTLSLLEGVFLMVCFVRVPMIGVRSLHVDPRSPGGSSTCYKLPACGDAATCTSLPDVSRMFTVCDIGPPRLFEQSWPPNNVRSFKKSSH